MRMTEEMLSGLVLQEKGSYKVTYHPNGRGEAPIEMDFTPPFRRIKMMDALKELGLDVPAPDLLIRPGGERRLSNFLLWELAYAELHFCDSLWPEFSAADFQAALDWFASRERRFGD